MRVLVVEDETRLANNIAQALHERCGFAVDCAENGLDGVSMAEFQHYDLLLLDLMLPGLDGLAVVRRIRARRDLTPILILTAATKRTTVVQLLNAGADDYLTKPFDLGELIARAKALIRRGKGTAHPGPYGRGRSIVNTVEQTVRCSGQLDRPLAHGVPPARIPDLPASRDRLRARAARASLRLQLAAPLQRHRGAHLQPAQEAARRRRGDLHHHPARPRLPAGVAGGAAMRRSSLSRQLIGGILLAELLCAAAFSAVALLHEMHGRRRAFDVMLRGRADSLLGAIHDAEDRQRQHLSRSLGACPAAPGPLRGGHAGGKRARLFASRLA